MTTLHRGPQPLTHLPTKEIQPASLPEAGADASSLRAKTGLVQRLGAAITTSRAAGEALKRVETERVRVETSVALTGLKLAEAKIKTALVSAAMPQIGALALSLNAATMSVDEGLTNGAAAEVISHLRNRTENANLAAELQGDGAITSEEAATLRSFVDHDAATDIESSRSRMVEAKDAVRTLHAYALASIAQSKIEID
jgi:hypothetical protein